MRTILKLKANDKKEAIDALKKAIDHLENCVGDADGEVKLKVSVPTNVEKVLYM